MYVTYDEAAQILGIQRTSVKQLVKRGNLQSFPVPGDGRMRCLLRAQVEDRKAHRARRSSLRAREIQKLTWQQEALRRRMAFL